VNALPGAGMLASEQAGHPPWPHRHLSSEGALVKAVLMLLVLAVGGFVAVRKAWEAWWKRRGRGRCRKTAQKRTRRL
jgi:hypothetical protein